MSTLLYRVWIWKLKHMLLKSTFDFSLIFIWKTSWLSFGRFRDFLLENDEPPLHSSKAAPLFRKHQWSQFSQSNNVILLQSLYTSWMWPLFYTLQVPSSSIQACYFHSKNNPTSEPCMYLHKWSHFPVANLYACKCQRFVTEYAFFKREWFHGKPIWQMMDLCSEYSTITNRLLRAFESTAGSSVLL